MLSSSHPSTCRSPTAFKIMLIILSGDVELHPGPTKSIPAFPCTMCSSEVSDDEWALECDKCNLWWHIEYSDMNDEEYAEFQNKSSFVWHCPGCEFVNFSFFFFFFGNFLE